MEGLPCRFGKYTLIRKLATGGMAELFLAIQKSVAGFEKLIVIKRILPSMNQDRAFIEMLLHEARIAATLSHPNIVQIFDVGSVDGTYFIAMEHVHGEDLRSIVRQMKKKAVVEFPLEHALSIVLGICSGLAYAHEKRDLDGTALNIVHRDISPQNVVVTFTGDVKIVDFGIAKSDSKLNDNTKSGKLKGKIPYMSPEQAKGDPIDLRSDIFAAGVMLFELTTGKRLFKGASEYETLKLICERDYPLPSQVRAGYPRELEQIVTRALTKNRDQRWQSAREMQGAIETFVRNERIAVSTIALSQFMQNLFEDKLKTQKEALLQGKQLADIIALEHGPETGSNVDASGRHSSYTSGTGARTITGETDTRRGRSGMVVGLIGVIAAASVGLGTFWWMKHRQGAVQIVQVSQAGQAPLVRGAVAIASDPPGAAIFLNGEARPEKTPATLAKLSIGTPYEIKLTKDGFQDAVQTITLTDQDSSSAVSVLLKRGTLTIEVALKPPVAGANFVIDKKTYPSSPIDGITAGEPHTLLVQAPGYYSQSFSFTGNVAETKHYDVSLNKAGAGGGGAQTSQPGTTPAATGTGKINVSARGGWCNVSIDGSPRGPTPVAGVVVSAGNHSITCTTEGGKTMSGGVKVEPDGTARYSFQIPQ
jgi:serine/threonine protein kinase